MGPAYSADEVPTKPYPNLVFPAFQFPAVAEAHSSWLSWRTRPSAVGQFIIIHIVCKARSVVRIRGTGIVVRVRVRDTAIRVRAVVRPVHNTTLEEVCLVFY